MPAVEHDQRWRMDKDPEDASWTWDESYTLPENMFLASERSNHISGKLIHVNDDWKRFEQDNMKPELYTLRRVQRI